MGEAKRRKATMGDKIRQDRFLPWIPISKTQAELFVKWSNRAAWIGIGLMIVAWVTIRFIGPGFGWWQVV